MELSLIIFLGIVAVSAYRGYRSGTPAIVGRLFSVALGYAAAILFTDSVAGLIQQSTPIKGLLSFFAAGTLLFVIASLVFSSIFKLAISGILGKQASPSQASAIGGGMLGATLGCFIGILAIWFFTTFHSLLLVKAGNEVKEPGAFQQKVLQISEGAMEGIAEQGFADSDLATGTAKLLSNPAKNIKHYTSLAKNGELKRFFQNPQVRNALDSRNAAALLNNSAFKSLATNKDFKALVDMLNLDADPIKRDQLLATKVTKMWAQINRVQDNPRFQQITSDPFIRRSLQSGSLLDLLNNQDIAELINIISSTDVGEIKYDPNMTSSKQDDGLNPNVEEPEVKSQQVYRWVDEKGKVHYSDRKKEN